MTGNAATGRGPTAGRTVLRGGTVVDGSGAPAYRGDIAVAAGRTVAIGPVAADPGDAVLDCTDRLVLPGLIDAHSHAEATVFDPDVQLALLRQGVTTVITGQDGVSFAPGDGRYAADYFAALNGEHPRYRGGGVAALLSSYDGTTPVNVGYLVPHGTVRYEVLGHHDRVPSAAELRSMCTLVGEALEEGALGMSTGFDYAPGYFAHRDELVALARLVARADGLYVSHLRGYEGDVVAGMAELVDIHRSTAVSVHASHLHAPADLIETSLREAGDADLSFDAYPYRRGCSLLAMPMVPPALLGLGVAEVSRQLLDPAVRAHLVRDWIPRMAARPDLGDTWADGITIAGVAAPADRWAQGSTLSQGARRAGLDPAEFGYRLLAGSGLAVSAVLEVPHQRDISELARVFTLPAHVGSSDGIHLGGHPHPRGWGAFARFLGLYTRQRGDFSFERAAVHLSARTASRHRLPGRGRIAVGCAADLAVVDPRRVGDTATYDDPRSLAVGIDDVLVNGIPVLRRGALTGLDAGQGLRRGLAP